VRVVRISIPEWIDARQKANAITLMREMFDNNGHLAYRSSSNLVFYERVTPDNGARQPHLALQAATGGAANRAELISADEWVEPVGESNGLADLESEFHTIFDDGIAVDLDTRHGRRALGDLEQSLVVGILPMAMKSLDQGAVVTSVSGRSISAIFHGGKLRLVFILPPEFDGTGLRRWRRTVNEWQAHVRSR
jgi:hypothetical protein